MDKKKIGQFGEDMACQYLQIKGYEIVERNFQNRVGEIDIIAKKEDVLIFLEVKTRKNADFCKPSTAVNKRKQNKIRTMAKIYIQEKLPKFEEIRFDIIEVCIEHIKGGF